MFPRGGAFAVTALRRNRVQACAGKANEAAYLEGRCRGVARLIFLPKAAYLERRCRGVVRLEILPKAAYLQGRCPGGRPFKNLVEARFAFSLISFRNAGMRRQSERGRVS